MAKWKRYGSGHSIVFVARNLQVGGHVFDDKSWFARIEGRRVGGGQASTIRAAKSAVINCIQGELLKALRETGWEEKS